MSQMRICVCVCEHAMQAAKARSNNSEYTTYSEPPAYTRSTADENNKVHAKQHAQRTVPNGAASNRVAPVHTKTAAYTLAHCSSSSMTY